MKKENSNYPIKVLSKTFSILKILLQQGFPMNITEINEKFGHFFLRNGK